MANNTQQMIFEITGNETGLQRSLKNAGNGLTAFGNQAGGIFGNLTSSLSAFSGQVTGVGSGLVGLAGSVGIVAGVIGGLVLTSNDYVKTLIEISRASGITVEQLQKQQAMFQGLGLDVEKLGDINRDVLDHLGDAWRDGSGPAADMKKLGLNLKDYEKYLNDAEGGTKALAKAFYDMKAAGQSTATITNMLETLGSDGSKLVDVLKRYSTEQDFLNALQSQHVTLTNENAKAYQEFNTKIETLTTNFQLWKANALTPTIDEINTLFDWFNADWDRTKLMQLLKDGWDGFWFGGDGAIADGMRKLFDKKAVDFNSQAKRNLQGLVGQFASDIDNITKTAPPKETSTSGGWKDKEAEQKAAAAAAKAAATKAESERKQHEAKRIQAQKVLEQTLSGIAGSGAIVQVQQFNEQQDAIEKRIRDSSATLGKTEAETTAMLKQQYESRKRLFKEMTDSMLEESDPKKLAQNIAAIGGQGINGKQLSDIQNAQNQRLGIDNTNPFQISADKSTLDKIQSDGQAELALNQQLYEQKLMSYQDYQNRMAAISQATTTKIEQANVDAANKTLSMYAAGASNLGTTLSGVFGESSAAAQASFAISKGIAIAQSIINIQQGISEAIKLGWPMGIAAGLKVAAQGASIVSTIKGTKIQGQAHDGWDSLPSTGTYNLEKGERVVGKSLNQDLTKYLSNQDGSKSGDIKIDAPLIINSNGQISDSDFQKMCDKHADTIVQATRKSQKNNV
ncbi:hypothetical protein R2W49_004187 [Klebsiella variicola]|nr:hypothetical protein [Klebsiella variicola]ELQ4153146.1 hypothetical protein [Klebsiella variicola]